MFNEYNLSALKHSIRLARNIREADMSNAQTVYQEWLNNPRFDEATHQELLRIKDDPEEINNRFYQNLAFGTAGLRGVLAAGTNRMNRYTIAWAAEGFALYLASLGDSVKHRGIVISYDSRHFSREFALITARIMAGHGILVRLSDELRPVPMLSFAIRHFKAAGGVMITASHNPPKYNGFKAYGEDGAQLPPEAADAASRYMNEISDLAAVEYPDEQSVRDSGLLTDFGPEIDTIYTDMLMTLSINREACVRNKDMKIVYTPLHGCGNKPVRRALARIGFENVLVVPEQELPDPDFSTVDSPNPEERSALAMGIELARQEQADLVIATDPDADRTGLCVRTRDGSYKVLTGNQIGVLLLDYILGQRSEQGRLPDQAFAVTTIVSTRLSRRIASHYGIRLFECLTGFKYIAELIKEHDEQGDMAFQFGFEESFGYLAGRDVRDKDAVVTSMLIAEMAASARDRGLTLDDLLQNLFSRFGHMAEQTIAITREGKEGLEAIAAAMDRLRAQKKQGIKGVEVLAVDDYLELERLELSDGSTRPIVQDSSNVLVYDLPGDDWFGVRPSGTEPKIKIYFGIYGKNQSDCDARLDQLVQTVEAYITQGL